MRITGHIRPRKRKNGQKVFQLVAELPPDPLTGKRQRKYDTVTGSKKDAEAALRKLLEDIQRGEYVNRSNITIAEWMPDWFDLYVKDGISPVTQKSYIDNMNRYIFPLLGNVRIQELTTNQVQRFINRLNNSAPTSGAPLKPKTVRNIFLNLSASMEKAEQLEMIHKSPCRHAVLPKAIKVCGTAYDIDEVQALLNAAKGTDLEVPLYIEVCLGLRRGELLALKYSSINWETNVISITESMVKVGSKVIVKEPKTQSGKRDLVAPAHLMKMLREHHVWYLEQKLKLGADFTDSDLVVCQANGKPYYPDNLSHMFRDLLLKNGLRYIRFHDLRHTNASLMIANGIDVKVAQERLGHSDVTTTLNIYSHVLKHANEAAAVKLDNIVFSEAAN